MLTELHIDGYRAFKHFDVPKLGRVNLFVGPNNCGKTTLLEAAQLLVTGGRPQPLIESVQRRGEFSGAPREMGSLLDASHLFHNHDFHVKTSFAIGGTNGGNVDVSCEIARTSEVMLQLKMEPSADSRAFPLAAILKYSDANRSSAVNVDWSTLAAIPRYKDANRVQIICLSATAGIDEQTAELTRIQLRRECSPPLPTAFVSCLALDNMALFQAWNEIALTSEEHEVVQSLQLLEPGIERLAFLFAMDRTRPGATSGMFVKLAGSDARIPLGSLGEGMRQILYLSVALIGAKGGAAMIDEIDTGLHYSVMKDMWKMVITTAKRLDVQVFATTHSLDCVRGLAELYRRDPELMTDVCLHRVELEEKRTVPYPAEEINIAIQHEMELR